MIIKAKFNRLKINAGLTEDMNCSKCDKTSEKEFHQALCKFPIDKIRDVWVESFQVKMWYQW